MMVTVSLSSGALAFAEPTIGFLSHATRPAPVMSVAEVARKLLRFNIYFLPLCWMYSGLKRYKLERPYPCSRARPLMSSVGSRELYSFCLNSCSLLLQFSEC